MVSDAEIEKTFSQKPLKSKLLDSQESLVFLSNENKSLFSELMLQRLVQNNGLRNAERFINGLISNVGNDKNLCKIEFKD